MLARHENVVIESGGITWLYNAEFYPYPSAVRAIREAADLVNASVEGEPASYVITYSSSNPTIVVVDPNRDITAQVVKELNKKCTKKSDK